jgi:acyl-CoA synthetase (AMP-forming)/AMP-acid ligase II
MLYERWRQTARERGRELALRELASGRQWTFVELARRVERLPRCDAPVVFPQGHAAEFIFAVLRGWRDKAVVCPLEPDQPPPPVRLLPAPCCHLKTTSATTGQPRQIAFRAQQLAADAENIVATMGLRPDWPNLGVISLAHSYGFSNLVLPLLLHGIPLILSPSPLPEAVRGAAAFGPVLTLPAVPALWSAWHEAAAIPKPIRLAISAGAPLPVALEQAVLERTGLKIHNFYGSSECGGIAYDASSEARSEDDCAGTPVRDVQVTLNKSGCVRVTSQAVGETYWPDPGEALGSGRFQTSDLAELKGEWVYLRGRLGDQINVAGRKVSPASIERVLAQHSAVKDCLVFGVPSDDADRTEVVVACVAASAPAGADELRQFLLARLPAWQVPRKWWLLDSLSANQRGKLSRAEWRKRFMESGTGRTH